MRLLIAFLFSLWGCVGARAGDGVIQHRLKLMQFNVWQEGTQVTNGFDKMIDVMLASDADLVALSEVRNYQGKDFHERILAALKVKAPERKYYGEYAGGDVGLISRFPIEAKAGMFDGTANDTGSIKAWRMTLPGELKATICSAHLDYRGYGLYLVRGYEGGYPHFKMRDADQDGVPDRVTDVEEIMAYNRRSQRNKSIADFLAFAQQEEAAGRVVILAGDFNEGSHLDWTERAKHSFGHYGVALPWDNSIALQRHGFLDAYRVVHPDEIEYPGFTWPAIADGKETTSWALKADERDRIDFIYYGTRVIPAFRATQAWLVGPKACFIGNEKVPNPGRDPYVGDALPWPSDHAGVLVEFTW